MVNDTMTQRRRDTPRLTTRTPLKRMWYTTQMFTLVESRLATATELDPRVPSTAEQAILDVVDANAETAAAVFTESGAVELPDPAVWDQVSLEELASIVSARMVAAACLAHAHARQHAVLSLPALDDPPAWQALSEMSDAEFYALWADAQVYARLLLQEKYCSGSGPTATQSEVVTDKLIDQAVSVSYRDATSRAGQGETFIYVTKGDNKVRPRHAALHGLVFKGNLASAPWPPLGFGCRCTAQVVPPSLRDKAKPSPAKKIPPDPGFKTTVPGGRYKPDPKKQDPAKRTHHKADRSPGGLTKLTGYAMTAGGIVLANDRRSLITAGVITGVVPMLAVVRKYQDLTRYRGTPEKDKETVKRAYGQRAVDAPVRVALSDLLLRAALRQRIALDETQSSLARFTAGFIAGAHQPHEGIVYTRVPLNEVDFGLYIPGEIFIDPDWIETTLKHPGPDDLGKPTATFVIESRQGGYAVLEEGTVVFNPGTSFEVIDVVTDSRGSVTVTMRDNG